MELLAPWLLWVQLGANQIITLISQRWLHRFLDCPMHTANESRGGALAPPWKRWDVMGCVPLPAPPRLPLLCRPGVMAWQRVFLALIQRALGEAGGTPWPRLET